MLLAATGSVLLQFFFSSPCVRFNRLPIEFAR